MNSHHPKSREQNRRTALIADWQVRAALKRILAGFVLPSVSVAVILGAGFTWARAQEPSNGGQQITVRFINPKSGKPLRKMWVGVTQWKGEPPKGESNVPYILGSTNAQTNRNGEVVFMLSDPPPMFVSVQSFDLWYSGSLIPTSKVLESGVILDYSDAKPPRGYWVNKQGQLILKSGTLLGHGSNGKPALKLKIKAKPGEIIYIEKKITLWQRMRQEIP